MIRPTTYIVFANADRESDRDKPPNKSNTHVALSFTSLFRAKCFISDWIAKHGPNFGPRAIIRVEESKGRHSIREIKRFSYKRKSWVQE